MLFEDGPAEITVWNAEGFGSPALPQPDYGPAEPIFDFEAFRDTVVGHYRQNAFDPLMPPGEQVGYWMLGTAAGFDAAQTEAAQAEVPPAEPVGTVTVGPIETVEPESDGGGGGGEGGGIFVDGGSFGGGFVSGGFGGFGGFGGGSGGGTSGGTVTVGEPEQVETQAE
ncbi:hypothetical protein [Pseudoroseomonas cervicalis]|uniref:hypothetical protein n=1 Tax=Teichococcus cervicalis TaxID=204525 RepID=UPI0022F1CEFA|nr:hypothetical protein [Pseudoroseomonas cervicalis]WBV43008.1 hypothetical protein PFY06_00110 [Pseudoroseomonas cervicalis]